MPQADSAADESSRPTDPRRFATTSWSLVVQAADPDGSSAVHEALEELCRAYWYPLYAFVRRQGYDAAQAEDLTQGFFAQMLGGGLLAKADERRGRFRTFLLKALQNYLANQLRDGQALKRGGAQAILSLDFAQADQRFQRELADHSDPLHSYETQWAWNVLHLALAAVRSQYEAQGKIDLFEALCPLLTRESSQSLAEIAERLGMQVGAVKVAAHRLRDRYGQQIRLQIARTVDDPQEVDEELRELFRVFSADRL